MTTAKKAALKRPMTPGKQNNRAVFHRTAMRGAGLLLALGLTAAFGLSGCDPQTRHGTLSFFFDGVPAPADPRQGAAPGTNGVARRTARTEAERPRSFQHGPYGAKLCDGCHVRDSNNLIMPLEELCTYCHVFDLAGKKVHGPLASGGCTVCHDPHESQNPMVLVANAREFCLYCHERKDLVKQDAHADMQLECTLCHDAHSSKNASLLK
jgi:predicted CXXCH cytochrome family protein